MEHVIALAAGLATAILAIQTIRHLRVVARREAIVRRVLEG